METAVAPEVPCTHNCRFKSNCACTETDRLNCGFAKMIESVRAICVTCGALIISDNGSGDKTISPNHSTLSLEQRNRLGKIFCKQCRND